VSETDIKPMEDENEFPEVKNIKSTEKNDMHFEISQSSSINGPST